VTPTRPPPARKAPGFVARARRILFQPEREWEAINGEFTKAPAIFRSYVIPVSAVPPVAYIMGAVLFAEQGTLFGTVETTVGAAVQDAVIRYLCGLASVFLLGLALEVLAPAFLGQGNRVQGLKVAAYASTPAWLFGALAIVPRLGRYSIAGTLWTLYLVYSGAPLLMKVSTAGATVFGLAAAAAAAVVALLVEGLRLLT
jgi:Yip1-like protein